MSATKNKEFKEKVYDSEIKATQMATFNIREDFSQEILTNETIQLAMFNILEDSSNERGHLVETQKAILNILEDYEMEKLTVKASLIEKEVLLKEIHHRVKNNLQITSSLLSLQSNYISDPHAREIFLEGQNRISSIALVHEKLYKSNNLSRINFSEYIEELAHLLLSSFGIEENRIRLSISKESILLKIEIAVPLGLIINELLSNSIKHAFPNGRQGEISIKFKKENGELQFISLSDNGIGVSKDFEINNTKTLGLKLVQTLVKQLDAKLKVITNTSGIQFIVDFSKTEGAS
jgi:two-component sensor histidine kinase